MCLSCLSIHCEYGTLCSGPPSAVVDLKATSDSTSITISWEAPWSLDVTGVDPDIWYSVLIQNVTDENNPTPISCTDCTNITETVYTFTPDHLSPCHVYKFSVTPFNGAGQGKSDNAIAGWFSIYITLQNSSQCWTTVPNHHGASIYITHTMLVLLAIIFCLANYVSVSLVICSA